jgi:hypothetical protein
MARYWSIFDQCDLTVGCPGAKSIIDLLVRCVQLNQHAAVDAADLIAAFVELRGRVRSALHSPGGAKRNVRVRTARESMADCVHTLSWTECGPQQQPNRRRTVGQSNPKTPAMHKLRQPDIVNRQDNTRTTPSGRWRTITPNPASRRRYSQSD